ncbi:DMT family transporter [Amycolatopsis palatopharyngis]|uniref:DMT family transporter n=1 Tax=Amycolatopsis palatopharyngis TaxID=187982 RepID=UPI000E277A6D|nr:EamA family transporter [Amycolatopsis palatopharyngis]
MSEGKTLATMGALALMWGSSFLWIKVGLDSFSPVQLVLIRLVLGTTVLLGLCAAYRHRLPARRRVWGHLAVAAMFHNALPFLLFAIGEQTVDSGVTGVINSTTPLWALAVALVWRIERRLNGVRMLGLLLGIAGTMLIFAPWQSGGLLSWGALACLAASASYGFVFVYEGRFLVETGASPIALAAAQMISASGFMLLAVPVGGLSPIHLETGPLFAVVVLGIFSTGIAFALNYRLISAAGAVAASTVGYLLPVVSVLMGTLFLNEALNLRVVAGMVVVLAGVGLTRVRRRADQVPAPATTAEVNPGDVVRS